MISGRKMTEKLGHPITNEEIDIPKVLEKVINIEFSFSITSFDSFM
jgi:hypothetical protein